MNSYSWSLEDPSGLSWSFVVTRSHSWSLVCSFRHDPNYANQKGSGVENVCHVKKGQNQRLCYISPVGTKFFFNKVFCSCMGEKFITDVFAEKLARYVL